MKKHSARSKRRKKKTLKKGFLVFSIMYALVIVIGSTYAWVTMADERINRVTTNKIDIKVEGDQTSTLIGPGTVADKNITVRNISESAEFVRVSLEELLLTFEIDLTDQKGNGNVKEFTSVITPEIKRNDSQTWVVGKSIKKEAGVYFKSQQKESNQFLYGDPARETTLFQFIDLDFPEVYTTIQLGSNYWLYEAGYFYYSEVLKPNQKAELLIKSFTTTQDTPNSLKQSLYGVVVEAEGYSITEPSLELMGLTTSDLAYQLLNSRIN